jgi:hypothetical protein
VPATARKQGGAQPRHWRALQRRSESALQLIALRCRPAAEAGPRLRDARFIPGRSDRSPRRACNRLQRAPTAGRCQAETAVELFDAAGRVSEPGLPSLWSLWSQHAFHAVVSQAWRPKRPKRRKLGQQITRMRPGGAPTKTARRDRGRGRRRHPHRSAARANHTSATFDGRRGAPAPNTVHCAGDRRRRDRFSNPELVQSIARTSRSWPDSTGFLVQTRADRWRGRPNLAQWADPSPLTRDRRRH